MTDSRVGARTHSSDAAAPRLRRAVYWLLIAAAVGQASGRLLAVNSIDRLAYDSFRIREALDKTREALEAKGVTGTELEEKLRRRSADLESKLRLDRPFLSSNDRSRWLTVRSLVEYGTYEIDKIISDEQQFKMWDTIDMVKHPGRDGQGHLYSSKPPLLATLLAGPYWVIYHTTGLSLRDNPHTVGRILLFLVNVLPLGIYLWLLGGIVERHGTTDFGRLLVMVTAAFGTFLTTFAVTLNNHLHAAVFVTAALSTAMPIWYDGRREWRYFAAAGFCAAMAAACELPALAFCVALAVAVFWKAPRPALVGFLPAALLVAAGHFGATYAAHGSFDTAYGKRDFSKDEHGKVKDWTNGNWYNYDYYVGKVKKQSYWSRDEASLARRSALDRGERSPARYAFHALLGHHGIFSLTPIWLLSLVGLGMMLRRTCAEKVQVIVTLFRSGFGAALTRARELLRDFNSDPTLRPLCVLITVLCVVCIGFYLMQGEENRNYGGGTSGLRWAFWLVPLWLIALLPAADWTSGRRWAQLLAAALLALSALSASYPTWNPWSNPWIMQWMQHMGWLAQ